jgi:PAS domain S-box-containing protein
MTKATVVPLPEAVGDLTEAPINVLHVDDDADYLKTTKQIVEMQGSFKVETAPSVEEAQEKMRKKEFDVIISDYIMPRKDGLEFLRELRDSGNKIPFIIFTGKGREIVAIKALNLGADQYINKIGKPEVIYTELSHAIREVVKIKQAGKALQKSEESYRRLFENAPVVILTLDLKGNVTSINKVAEEYGFKKDEIIGKNMHKLVFKRYWPKLLKDLVQLSRGKTVKGEIEIDTPKGKKTARYKSNPIIIDNKVVGSQVVLTDITEHKKVEEALLEAEEKYRKTILSANVGIINSSPEGKVKILNPKMEHMIGFKRSEIRTLHHWFEKLYPNEEERRKIRDRWFKRMSEEGEVKEGHAIITTKDGKRRNFLFNAVRLESGESIAFAEDITERKEAEKKLDKMMNELATINEKLGVVSKLTRHDARNKLSTVLNNIYLAKQTLTDEHEALKYLGAIESSCDQIEEIFDFASMYKNLGTEELSYVNVSKNVKEAAMLFSDLHGVKIVNNCCGLNVLADSLLRQLFYNLIDNSLRHGEKVSRIRVYYEEEEIQLKLIYEDDGIGIPEDEKELIFKEGYGKGTGYGLYLIRKICEAYGWTIKETGKQGKGAQFTMTIPKTNKNEKRTCKLS